MKKNAKKIKQHIIVIDDEHDIRQLIDGILQDEGYETTAASNGNQALNAIYAQKPDLAIIDIWLKDGEMDGIELLEKVKKIYPDMPILIISGHGNIATAVNAIKKGAYDYLEKPFKIDKILNTIARALEVSSLRSEVKYLKEENQKSNIPIPLLGKSINIVKIRNQVNNIATTNARILIQGEKNTGKTNVAKSIHEKSEKAQKSFMTIDFQKIKPEETLAKLFGSELRPVLETGIFEKAKNSTVLLKEIGFANTKIKSKLISTIQKGYYYRVAGRHRVKIDCRIISTMTTKNNQQKYDYITNTLIDLLGVFKIKMPTLSDRSEDIPDMAMAIIKEKQSNSINTPVEIPDNFFEILKTRNWYGNISALNNFIEGIMINAAEKNQITTDMLFSEHKNSKEQIFNTEILLNYDLKKASQMFEKQYIIGQLRRFNNNISKTSDFIGVVRSTLHRKLKDLEIQL